MSDINAELLQKLEQLTRISVPESDRIRVIGKIEAILQDFSLLQQAPVENLEPLFHYTESMVLRDDIAQASIETESLMKNAPHSDGVHYLVPSFIGEGEP